MNSASRELWKDISKLFGLEGRHVISFELKMSVQERPVVTIIERVEKKGEPSMTVYHLTEITSEQCPIPTEEETRLPS